MLTESGRKVQIHSHPINLLFQSEPSVHRMIEPPYYVLKELSGFKMIFWWVQKRLCSTSQKIVSFSTMLSFMLCCVGDVRSSKALEYFFQSSIIRCQSVESVCVTVTTVLTPGVLKTSVAAGVEIDISEKTGISSIENNRLWVDTPPYSFELPRPSHDAWYIITTKGVNVCRMYYRSVDNICEYLKSLNYERHKILLH